MSKEYGFTTHTTNLREKKNTHFQHEEAHMYEMSTTSSLFKLLEPNTI